MKTNIPRQVVFSMALFVAAVSARANNVYSIQDLGTYAGYEDTTLSDTFAGTGFVGIYSTAGQGPSGAFGHLFGLENYNGAYSESELEVNISGLSDVSSAILSYNLLNGSAGSQSVTVTSFSANGSLGFNQTPPSNLGTTTFTSTGLSANSVDVTTLLQNAIAANQTWFGLYLTPNGPNDSQWTYTWSADNANPNSASVQLTVTTVPEPSTFALAIVPAALALIGIRRRHFKRAAQ